MKSVVLIHPPHYDSTEDRLDAPLGLLYIASFLESNDVSVKICDLSGVPKKEWEIPEADIYGITTYISSLETVKELINFCRTVNSKSLVVCGGAHPSCDAESVFDIGADVVVRGPGEHPMLQLIAEYPNHKKLYDGSLEYNLNKYPNPDYSLVDVQSYKRKINNEKSITMLTSRGCIFKCVPCSLSKVTNKVHFRSPHAVASEILFIKKHYGIHSFNFQDDMFCLNRARLYDLCDYFKFLNISFRAHGRSGYDVKEDYKRLKEAGCSVLAFGIESGSQYILDRMNKQTTVENNYKVIQWAKEYGIETRAFFIFGFPGETEKTIEETKRFIEKADPDQYFVSNFIPYPQTDCYCNPEKYGITKMNTDYNNYIQVKKDGEGGVVFATEWLSMEEFKVLEKDFREWLSNRKQRGCIQDYEIEMEEKQIAN